MIDFIVTYIPHTFMHNFASAEPFFFFTLVVYNLKYMLHILKYYLVVILLVVILIVVILLAVNPKDDML